MQNSKKSAARTRLPSSSITQNTCAKRARAVSEDGWKTACTSLFSARTDADRYRSDTLESTSPHGPANGAFSRVKKMLYAAEEKGRQGQKRATLCC